MVETIREFLLRGEKEESFVIKDISTHGLGGGIVSELIYYHDINKFYDKHHQEIWEELDGNGGIKQLMEGTTQDTEPSSDAHFKCLITWLGVESVACQILNEREQKTA
tara:strand:+ start:335 stop:658 length:324 start_codon:yes stop_codon:yes gene_type:complete